MLLGDVWFLTPERTMKLSSIRDEVKYVNLVCLDMKTLKTKSRCSGASA